MCIISEQLLHNEDSHIVHHRVAGLRLTSQFSQLMTEKEQTYMIFQISFEPKRS